MSKVTDIEAAIKQRLESIPGMAGRVYMGKDSKRDPGDAPYIAFALYNEVPGEFDRAAEVIKLEHSFEIALPSATTDTEMDDIVRACRYVLADQGERKLGGIAKKVHPLKISRPLATDGAVTRISGGQLDVEYVEILKA